MAKKPLEIDMIAGSQLRDTQGEMLSVEGADISELEAGKGRLNDNHGKGFFNAIGRVTGAKKIFKREDCENERHEYYWDKVKAPFIFVKGYLYDDEDHPNAKAAAAILRNIHKADTPLQLKASVEGGVLSRGISDNSLLARTKIHSVALTFTPANNNTLVEPVSLNKTEIDEVADMLLIKSVLHLAETNVPSFRHIARDASASKVQNNLYKLVDMMKDLGIEGDIVIPSKHKILEKALEQKIADNVEKIKESIASLNKGDVIDMFPKKTMERKVRERAARKQKKDPLHQPETRLKSLDEKGHWSRDKGISEAGADVRHYKRRPEDAASEKSYGGGAWGTHRKVLSELKAQPKPKLTKAELEKGAVKNALAAAGTAAAMSLAPTPVHEAKAPMERPKPSAEAVYQNVAKQYPLLGAIGFKESSGGKNIQHPTMTEGPHKGHTAGGMFGMMPNSAAFILAKDPNLAKKYPKLVEAAKNVNANHKQFTDTFNSDPQAAADFAVSYFNRNKSKTKSDQQLAYSWLNGLKGSWNQYKEGGSKSFDKHPYVQDVMAEYAKLKPKKVEQKKPLKKALMAGYGGAGAPTSNTSGGVIQAESVEQGRPSFKYVTCDNCGKEQVHAKYQVKCRDCGQSMSFQKLYDVLHGKK